MASADTSAERAAKRKLANEKRRQNRKRNACTKEYSLEELQDALLKRFQQEEKDAQRAAKKARKLKLTIETSQPFNPNLNQSVASHDALISNGSQGNVE